MFESLKKILESVTRENKDRQTFFQVTPNIFDINVLENIKFQNKQYLIAGGIIYQDFSPPPGVLWLIAEISCDLPAGGVIPQIACRNYYDGIGNTSGYVAYRSDQVVSSLAGAGATIFRTGGVPMIAKFPNVLRIYALAGANGQTWNYSLAYYEVNI